MTQIRIFEIDDDESDEDEYYTKRPKYANIIQEEDYEDEDDESQPVPWDFREDAFFQIETDGGLKKVL